MTIKERIRKFILEDLVMAPLPEGLPDDASLRRLSILDSTGVLEMVAFLEREFTIRILDGEMVPGNLDTVDAIALYVAGKLGQESSCTGAESRP